MRSRLGAMLLVLGVLLCVAVARGVAGDEGGLGGVVPEKYREEVERSLTLAGENASEIEGFLKAAPADRREAACFLVAQMAPGDLAVASSIALAEHLEYAFRTRDLLPWSGQVSDKLFLHYVLPPRVTQEPFEAWRKYLFDRVLPRIRHLDSMEDVALEINRWCKERFTYKPTQRRDQGIFESLRRGVGRCEEEMILYICAARAVGLPARACSTPLWSTCDSNHAWVEVWCDGVWHYLGACEPADTLDTAWFSVPAQRAPLVLSRIQGLPEDTQGLYRVFDRSALVNSTSVYGETGRVVMSVEPGAEVFFYVFNYGSLRPFSKREADAEGRVQVEFGPGEYPFTVANEGTVTRWGVAKVKAGRDAEIVSGEGPSPEGFLWLHYPKKGKRRPGGKPGPKRERQAPDEVEVPPDTHRVLHFDSEQYPEVMKRIGGHELEQKTVEALERSLGNCENLAAAIVGVGADDLADLLWLICELPDLDLIEATPEVLLEHVLYAKVARTLSKTGFDDATWREHVLSPRIAYEPLRAWRKDLFCRFHGAVGDDATDTARNVNAALAGSVKQLDSSRSGAWKDPLQVVRSGCGSRGEVIGCAVGLLRTLGVPAKVSGNRKWAEFHDGKEWQPLFPVEPERFKVKEGDAGVSSAYEDPGRLVVHLTRKGLPLAKCSDLAALKLGGSYWSTEWPKEETDDEGRTVLELAPGEYLFNTGVRNSNGDPYIYFKRVRIESGGEVRLEVALDPPVTQLEPEDLLVRELDGFPRLDLEYLSPQEDPPDAAVQLWVLFTLDNEACKSMLPRIGRFAAAARGLTAFYVYLGNDEKAFKAFAKEHDLGGGGRLLATADGADVAELLKLPGKEGALIAMPSVLLVRTRDRKVLFWDEGFNLAIDQTLRDVLDLVLRGE